MRGELRTPRNAVEYSETALTQEGGVGKPMDALGSERTKGIYENQETYGTVQTRKRCVNTKKTMNN